MICHRFMATTAIIGCLPYFTSRVFLIFSISLDFLPYENMTFSHSVWHLYDHIFNECIYRTKSSIINLHIFIAAKCRKEKAQVFLVQTISNVWNMTRKFRFQYFVMRRKSILLAPILFWKSFSEYPKMNFKLVPIQTDHFCDCSGINFLLEKHLQKLTSTPFIEFWQIHHRPSMKIMLKLSIK